MNVLIVDKDEKFANAISNLFFDQNDNHSVIYFTNDNSDSYKLAESKQNYDVKFISLDSISSKKSISSHSKSSLIGISPDNKTTKKFINDPNIQKIFQKPVDMVALAKYLNNYCGLDFFKRNENLSILNSLSKIGFGINNIGTIYLAECIWEAKNTFEFKLNELAKSIGKKNSVSPEIVIWSIRNAINRTIKIHGEEKIARCLKIYDGRKPTAKSFIEYFANTL